MTAFPRSNKEFIVRGPPTWGYLAWGLLAQKPGRGIHLAFWVLNGKQIGITSYKTYIDNIIPLTVKVQS